MNRSGSRLSIYSFVPGGNTPAGRSWLVTFTDLLCLILGFFVMVYAMSEPSAAKLRAVSAALTGHVEPTPDPGAVFNAARLDRPEALDLDYLANVFGELLHRDPGLSQVTLTRGPDRLVLAIPASFLFAAPETLSPDGTAAVFRLGGLVANLRNQVEIQGRGGAAPAVPVSEAASETASGTAPEGADQAAPEAEPAAAPAPDRAAEWRAALAAARSVATVLRRSGYGRDIVVRGGPALGEGTQEGAGLPVVGGSVEVVIRAFGDGR